MYSTISLLALILPAGKETVSISWHTNYRIAKAEGISKQKPLAMFVASGKEGWKKVLSEGTFNAEIKRILAENYVVAFIDLEDSYGKKIADMFAVEGGSALIISSRGGDLQAFRHDGLLSENDLSVCLNRYSAANHVVVTTESLNIAVSGVSSSYYAPAPVIQYYNPFGNCPSCRQQ
jgi:hypothetical protein